MMPMVRYALAAGLLACSPLGARAVEVGAAAPDFTLQDVEGTPHTLSALRGNAVLLAFIGYN
jgi:cytochrome oxidase Cu insertion factor (SCO1/SenC/PrrC family)